MNRCACCLGELAGSGPGHGRCLRRMFGAARLPEIDVDLARFQTLALASVGRSTLSGVQRKLSLEPSDDGRRLQVALGRARYILKPESREWEALPANEHLAMNLARLSGLEVPPFALVSLKDGTRAYLVRRFDRAEDGRKLACEDFCQLSEKPPKDKSRGSTESCAKLVNRHASEPGIELAALFAQVLFAWWCGDGDLHLKNLALLRHDDGTWRLSPAYDRVSTRLLIPRDELALTVQGRRSGLTRATWLAFAAAVGLPTRAAERLIRRQAAALDEALELTRRSELPAGQQETIARLLAERNAALA